MDCEYTTLALAYIADLQRWSLPNVLRVPLPGTQPLTTRGGGDVTDQYAAAREPSQSARHCLRRSRRSPCAQCGGRVEMQPPRARVHIPPMGVFGAVTTAGRPLSPLSAARASPVAARRRGSSITSPRLYPPTRRGRACPRGPQHARSTWEARRRRRRRPSRSRGGCSTGDARTPDLPALARAADPIGCESLGIGRAFQRVDFQRPRRPALSPTSPRQGDTPEGNTGTWPVV